MILTIICPVSVRHRLIFILQKVVNVSHFMENGNQILQIDAEHKIKIKMNKNQFISLILPRAHFYSNVRILKEIPR